MSLTHHDLTSPTSLGGGLGADKELAMAASSRRSSASDLDSDLSGGVQLPLESMPDRPAGSLRSGNPHTRNEHASTAFAVQTPSPVFSSIPQAHLDTVLHDGDLIAPSHIQLSLPPVDEDTDMAGAEAQEGWGEALSDLPGSIASATSFLGRRENRVTLLRNDMYDVEGPLAGWFRASDRSVRRFLDEVTPYGYHSCLPRPKLVSNLESTGEQCDAQGINWTKLDYPKDWARAERDHILRSDRDNTWAAHHRLPSSTAGLQPPPTSHFRFRRYNTEHRAWIAHYQLCNLISAGSSKDIYYAGDYARKVYRTDSLSQRTDSWSPAPASSGMSSNDITITTLSAAENLLVVGGYNGQYSITNLLAESDCEPTTGWLTHEVEGVTNHVDVYRGRQSGVPHAAFACNNSYVRVLDCTTSRKVHEFAHAAPINCTAMSPDGRLRLTVGDMPYTLITDAETGRTLTSMKHHTQDIFACAWADDGIHVATAAQDCQINIYDARRWDTPLQVLPTVATCARSLRFSPSGSGPLVLVAAEEDDHVDIIDILSCSFPTKTEVLDFYGAIAGISFSPDGSSLFVANADRHFGGIMEFDQTCHSARMSSKRLWDVHDDPFEWRDHRPLYRGVRARVRQGLGVSDVVI